MIANPNKKWWKIGAAAFLATGLLAACGDNESDDDMIDPMEEQEEQNTDAIEDQNTDEQNTDETEDQKIDETENQSEDLKDEMEGAEDHAG